MNRNRVIINDLINQCDILIEVLDSRLIEFSRIKNIEEYILSKHKRLIFAINKCELSDFEFIKKKKKELEKEINSKVVFVSAKENYGIKKLKDTLVIESKRIIQKNKETKDYVVSIGFFGYPNTGKSSLINKVVNRNSARTSSISGYTRGIQFVSFKKQIRFSDSPGVILSEDELKQALLCSKDFNKIKDPETISLKMISLFPKKICDNYSINFDSLENDFESSLEEKILDELGKKFNFKLKGNVIDTIRTSKQLISDWQKGKIRLNNIDITKLNEMF